MTKGQRARLAGARKGGKARAAALTPEQRSAIARKAGLASAARLTRKQRSESAQRASVARWGYDNASPARAEGG